MKLVNIHKNHLTNSLHLQFVIDVIKLIRKFNPVLLKIPKLFDKLCTCAEKEELCYKIIHKSNISKTKMEIDHARDTLVLGIKDELKAGRRHFDEKVREAAYRLKIVFDTYNKPISLANQPYDAETVGIYNFIKELVEKHYEDVKLVGLMPWLEKLRSLNEEFEQLTNAYTEQKAEKPLFQPKEARRETDEAYKKIVYAINGLIVLEDETEYTAFVNELNVLIKHYNDSLARHLGRIRAGKEEEKNKLSESELENEQDEIND
jgi:hypothetical protein